jgi:hypothetical protein
MAIDRKPKIIQITTGDHNVSPHLTSLRSGDLYHKKNQLTEEVAPQYFPEDKPFELGFSLHEEMPHKVQQEKGPTISERFAKKFASIRAKKIKKQAPKQQIAKQKRMAEPKKPQPVPHAPFRGRATIAFLILALAIVTPLKALTTFERLRDAKHDVENLKSAAGGGVGNNFDAVSSQITDALKSFHAANTTLKEIGPVEEFFLKNTPVIGTQYGVATRLVGAGEHVSFAAASYMQLFRTLKEKQDAPLIERLSMFFEGNRAVVSDLSAAADLVRPIDPQEIPEAQRAFVAQARDAILALSSDADYLASAGPVILSTLGGTAPRRYLIVFQNSTELRPTGGFIGSFAVLDIEKGEVKNLHVPPGGSYDLQGTLKKHIYAPLPLHLINTRWEFQDGNWFPDFPTSAEKLMWFLEKSQGPSVDGVIAINSSLLPELLSIVGPVKLAGKTTELTAETALDTVRTTIDSANKVTETKSKPKEIISEAAPAIIETLKAGKSEHFLPLINALLKGLERRDIQMYARDENLQKQIADFGWDGALRSNPNGDYLAVIGTNIGGQKTDALIKQTIDHQAKIDDSGKVIVTVRVSRAQRASSRALEDAPNISYVRFYVPLGAKLLDAQGFSTPSEKSFQAPDKWEQSDSDLERIEREIGFDAKSGTRITEELGHTAFGNWIISEPGGTAEVAISYELPFKIAPHDSKGIARLAEILYDKSNAASYSVYIQRQSGSSPTEVSSRVILPDGWRLGWITDGRAQIAENGALLTIPFLTDLHYGLTATAYAKDSTTKK